MSLEILNSGHKIDVAEGADCSRVLGHHRLRLTLFRLSSRPLLFSLFSPGVSLIGTHPQHLHFQ